VIALLALALAVDAPQALPAEARQNGRWTTACPSATKRRGAPSCVTSFRAPEVEIAVRAERRLAWIEVHADARDPFSGERCEWWGWDKLPEGRGRDDPAALVKRLNQSITLITYGYECRPAHTPQLGRGDGEHLLRFLAEARAALAPKNPRR
jgi:hypothetical protein